MVVPVLDDDPFEKSASWKETNALNEKTLVTTEEVILEIRTVKLVRINIHVNKIPNWTTYDKKQSNDLQNYFHLQFKKQKQAKDSKTRQQEYFVRDSMSESSFCEQMAEIQSNDSEIEVDFRETGEMRQHIHANVERKLFSKPKKQKWPSSIQLLLVCCIFIARSLCAAGESINVELATKPVLFAHDVDLICTIQTVNTPNHMAWIKIPNGETLAVNNKTLNNLKYQIKMNYELSAMKYTLRIKKFAQSDVNLLYRCDSEFLSQSENLQLNKEDYIAMPEEHNIKRKISISDGYLRATIEVNSVYPELNNCEAIFEGEDITNHLKTTNSSTTIGSIFYNMVIEISHKTVKCKGIMNVTCSVGIERIQLIIKDLDECSDQRQDKGISGLILTIVLPIVGLVILMVVCYVYFRRNCILKRKSQRNAMMSRYNKVLRDG